MDAEPFRCRRTDGKKWRCRLAVLPDQKYCERHVHRGRHRVCSRKPVETKSKSSHANTNLNKAQSLKIMENAQLIFSSQAVVQYDNGCGASSKCERCRRTDGKKWRCKKDALPGLKYCVQHMHRGVKKYQNSNHFSAGAPMANIISQSKQ